MRRGLPMQGLRLKWQIPIPDHRAAEIPTKKFTLYSHSEDAGPFPETRMVTPYLLKYNGQTQATTPDVCQLQSQ